MRAARLAWLLAGFLAGGVGAAPRPVSAPRSDTSTGANPGRPGEGQPGPGSREGPGGAPPGLPLVRDAGAWRWVGEMFTRLIGSAGLVPHVPAPAERVWLSRMPGDPPPGARSAPGSRSTTEPAPAGPGRARPTEEVRFEFAEGPLDATLLLVRHPSMNAFVTPGGRVWVTQPLLEFVRSDDELAGVLAHEIGHLTGKHLRKVAQKQTLMTLLGALAGGLMSRSGSGILAGQSLGQIASLGYNREAEMDADRRGYELMKLAGYHPVGMMDFLARLLEEERDAGDDPLSIFVSTHPPSSHRLARLRRWVAAEKGLEAPRGLSYDFARNLYGPGRIDLERAISGSWRTTAPTQAIESDWGGGIALSPVTVVEEVAPPPTAEEPGLRWAFRGWVSGDDGFEIRGEGVIPGPGGLLLPAGAEVLGPELELEPYASYLVSGRLGTAGGPVRLFLGLEYLDADGKVLGRQYPAAAGAFVEGGTVGVRGVSHPFDRDELVEGGVPARARLLVGSGRGSKGRVVVEELGFARVGVSPQVPGASPGTAPVRDTVGRDASR